MANTARGELECLDGRTQGGAGGAGGEREQHLKTNQLLKLFSTLEHKIKLKLNNLGVKKIHCLAPVTHTQW